MHDTHVAQDLGIYIQLAIYKPSTVHIIIPSWEICKHFIS